MVSERKHVLTTRTTRFGLPRILQPPIDARLSAIPCLPVALYYTILRYIILHYTILYYTILYCIIVL